MTPDIEKLRAALTPNGLDKDPESWSRVSPEWALGGSRAQACNVLIMAIRDIAKLNDCLVAARAILSTLEHADEAEGWRGMESAPKDGTPILITRETPFESEEGWHVVRWGDDEWWICHDGKNDHPLRGPDPTHWRPLPARPSSSPEREGE